MPSFVEIYCFLLFKCKVKRLILSLCTSQGSKKEIVNRKGNSRQKCTAMMFNVYVKMLPNSFFISKPLSDDTIHTDPGK